MSGQYRPDENALLVPPWTTINLANRDLAALVPIDFVPHAGVSLTQACFPNGIFEDSQAERCISNLLAAQFQRLVVDLYWDPSLRQFSLCPVSITSASQNLNSSSIPSVSRALTSQSISAVLLGDSTSQTPSVLSFAAREHSVTGSTSVGAVARQAASSTTIDLSNVTSSTSKSSTMVASPVATSTSPAGIILYNIGPYQCSSTLNLPFLASLVTDYVNQTSDTLSANLLFFQFNLHTATSGNATTDSAPSLSGTDLPSRTNLVGNIFNTIASPLPYQPSELLEQRANLNESWYLLSAAEQPVSEYFTLIQLPGGDLSTPDGWPGEYFVELERFNRVLLGWGSVDSQMEGYDFAGDRDVMFPQNHISSFTDVSTSDAGQLESGCFYNSGQTDVGRINSSWAISVLNDSFSSVGSSEGLWNLARNLTSCGITPILNMTIANRTADQEVSSYVKFVQSTVWNWAPGEPRNVSLSGASSMDDEKAQGTFRCALMETSTISDGGRWRVEYCNARHRAACRIGNHPYLWRLSDNSVPFSAAEAACQFESSFSAPRTGLENRYLYEHILSLPEASRPGLAGDDFGVWLDFNSLDVEACWVTTGSNGTCPYSIDEEALRQRTVLIPVIAALVVLLLTALTLFVKCNKNRRNSRKRIRGEGGWDYEGVPS